MFQARYEENSSFSFRLQSWRDFQQILKATVIWWKNFNKQGKVLKKAEFYFSWFYHNILQVFKASMALVPGYGQSYSKGTSRFGKISLKQKQQTSGLDGKKQQQHSRRKNTR